MYRKFFGLNDLPFRSTPDLNYFYNDASRGEIIDAICYSLDRGDGIVKVVGEVGSGKTTILRMLAQTLPSHYHIIYLNSPNLDPHDILLFICHEFGIGVAGDEHKFILVNKLRNFLLSKHAEGLQCVIMIDEAQSVPIITLEELRLLLNLETDQHKLVQILLFGQPELDQNLEVRSIRQFKSRISHSIVLPPFKSNDIHSYLNFRMRKAGYQGMDVFNSHIARKIAARSNGILRNIHNIADSALMSAYADESRVVRSKDISSNKISTHYLSPKYLGVALFIFLFILMVILFKPYFTENNHSVIVNEKPATSDQVESEAIAVTEYDAQVLEAQIIEKIEKPIENTDSESNPARVLDEQPVEIEVPLTENDIKSSDNIDIVLDRPPFFQSDMSDHTYHTSTLEWLLAKEDYIFSLQVITGGISDLERVVHELGSYMDSEDLFWVIDRPRYTLFFGFFSDFDEARSAISLLPNSYVIGNPIVVRRGRVISRFDTIILKNNADLKR